MDFLELAKSVIRQGNTRRKRWNRKNLNISWSVPGWHHRPSTTSLGASSWSRAMKPEKPYSNAIRANGLHKPRSTLSPMQRLPRHGCGDAMPKTMPTSIRPSPWSTFVWQPPNWDWAAVGFAISTCRNSKTASICALTNIR